MSEQYSQAEFLRDYSVALQAYTVPGYPAYEDRLRMASPDQVSSPDGELSLPYDASAPWCPADFYPTHATKPQKPGQFMDKGGVYPPTPEELALWESFGIRQDQRGMPVHPFAEAMLLGGQTPDGTFVQPGGVVTPAYYYKRGPQKTSDMLLLAPSEGKLYGLLVERKDNGLLASPGGHVDPEDTEMSEALGGTLSEYEIAGIRELEEEAGIRIDMATLSCSGLTVALKKVWAGLGADQRATLHSWPVGEGFAGILPAIPSQKPVAKTDAKTVSWRVFNEQTLAQLAKFSSHATIARRAIAAYEETTGTHVDANGAIHQK